MRARVSELVFGAALVFVAVVTACGGGDGSSRIQIVVPPGAPEPPPLPPAEGRVEPPLGSFANFDIVDDSFVDEEGRHDQEAEVTVEVDQVVTWTQNGRNIHRVEFNEVPPGAVSEDSRDLRPRATWEFRPKVPGQYVFFCRYHEYMMDVVINVVEDSEG
ncbi:MAG: hypothetical protein R3195_08805 [Gemmatimonadota bacterium]|nr:hypothetical protein [Gemmatimonadota bacterium]